MSIVGAWRPHHFGVSVPSLDEAIEWYGKMLGFGLEKREHIASIPADIAFLRCGDFRIELFDIVGAAALPPDRRIPNLDVKTHGNKHMCFEVQDVPAVIARLRAAGADIAYELTVNHQPVAFVRDCAGNIIEFLEPFASEQMHSGKKE